MYVCEFQKISNGTYFGRTTHPDRPRAESRCPGRACRPDCPVPCGLSVARFAAVQECVTSSNTGAVDGTG